MTEEATGAKGFVLTKKKIIFYALLAFVVATCLFTFILASTQVSSKKKTKAGAEIFAFNDDEDVCTDVMPHLPVRFKGDTEYLYCPWEIQNSAGRFLLSLVGIAWVVFGAWVVWKSDNRMMVLIFTIVSGVFSVSNFVMMVADSNAVNISSRWCNDNLDGLTIVGTWKCDYTPYALSCFADALNFLSWGAVVGFSFWYRGYIV